MISEYIYFKKREYLIISEKLFINLQICLDFFEINSIYKNGKYIINDFRIDYYEYIKNLDVCESLHILFYIVKKVGNIYYANYNKILLVKNLCEICSIEYEIDLSKKYIKLFIVEKLKYEKDEYFKGDIYFSKHDRFLFIKINKYVLTNKL